MECEEPAENTVCLGRKKGARSLHEDDKNGDSTKKLVLGS